MGHLRILFSSLGFSNVETFIASGNVIFESPAKNAQTLNPHVTRDPNAVSGIDGRPAKEAMDRYVDSFKSPPTNTNVINIGGSLNGGGQQ